MPSYRFVLRDDFERAAPAEEIGLFNDEGALQYARRIGRNKAVEIWCEARLVGRVEPRAADSPAMAVKTLA